MSSAVILTKLPTTAATYFVNTESAAMSFGPTSACAPRAALDRL
jgi:hypothetical protein